MKNVNNQIKILAVFIIIFYSSLLVEEYYFNKTYTSIELRALAIAISISWILGESLLKNYPKFNQAYQYIGLTYQLSFLSHYMLLTNPNEINLQFFFLTTTIWLVIFCNWFYMISILFSGVVLSYLLFFSFANTASLQSSYSLSFIIGLILAYATLYRYRNSRKAFDKSFSYRMRQGVDEIGESKGAVVNNLIHEIRNPLHGLLTITSVLKDSTFLPKSKIIKQVNIIYDTVEYLSNLTNEWLDYAKSNAGKMVFQYRPIDLVAIIQDTIKRSKELYLSDKNLEIIIVNDSFSQAIILGDAIKIYQLLTNLLTNAIKYSEHGTIAIKLNQIIREQKTYWEIMVVDQGIGISEVDLETIFDPFVRSLKMENANNNTGTGLGLAFCKEIVLGHDGLIWAANNENTAGATFTIILPVFESQNKEY